MDDSLSQILIENTEPPNNFNCFKEVIDEETDEESNCTYALNVILSGTARLNILLPSFTILAFTIFAPLLTNDGDCRTSNRWMMGLFWGISVASCIFFSLTDSFQTTTGDGGRRLYYGVATLHGLWVFDGKGKRKPVIPSEYGLRWSDLFHSCLSVVAFVTFAASQNDVVRCYYPAVSRKVTNTVPLVVGFVVSVLFVVFPSRRRGIGFSLLRMKYSSVSR